MRFPRTSRPDRIATAVLAVCALVVTAILTNNGKTDPVPAPPDSVLTAYDSFLKARNTEKHPRGPRRAEWHKQVRPAPFDPNTADSATLVSLSLRPRQAMAIVHYRNAGGKFRTAADLQRIYCLGNDDYRRLAPYIAITPVHSPAPHSAALPGMRPHKLRAGEHVDLNCRDTALLMQVPGVGSVTAKRIIAYGEKLGGYVEPRQIAEVYGMDSTSARWFEVSNPAPRRININRASFAQILHHPYINYRQTKHIFRLRREFGKISSPDALLADTLFSPRDMERLRPYIEL